jgi:hypothetical protein
VLQRCPRVVINPALKPDLRTGEEPCPWWDPARSLDEEAWLRVGPGALQVSEGIHFRGKGRWGLTPVCLVFST